MSPQGTFECDQLFVGQAPDVLTESFRRDRGWLLDEHSGLFIADEDCGSDRCDRYAIAVTASAAARPEV